MKRALSIFWLVLAAAVVATSQAAAQIPNMGVPGPYGFAGGVPMGPFGAGGMGFAGGGYGPSAGGYGFGPYGGGYGGGYGFGPYGGYGARFGGWGGYGGYGYGPWNYAQQLYQQQAAQSQQIFQQRQFALLGQLSDAQSRLESSDSIKQQMFQKYLGLNDSDKAEMRHGLMNEYLKLDAAGRERWKRDTVAQHIVGQDLQRLDGLARYRELGEADKVRFRQSLMEKYRILSTAEQQTWRNDPILGSILGNEWWLR